MDHHHSIPSNPNCCNQGNVQIIYLNFPWYMQITCSSERMIPVLFLALDTQGNSKTTFHKEGPRSLVPRRSGTCCLANCLMGCGGSEDSEDQISRTKRAHSWLGKHDVTVWL